MEHSRDRVTGAVFGAFALLFTAIYATVICLDLADKCVLTPLNHILHNFSVFLCFCLSAIFLSSGADTEKRRTAMKRAFAISTAIYVFTVLHLTLFDSYYGREGLSHISQWREMTPAELRKWINPVPFKTVLLYVRALKQGSLGVENIVINLVGNSVVFMPFALYLPVVFKKQRRFWVFALTMIAAVGCIELFQLAWLTGICDIDDLILNVAGACAAYGVLHIKPARKLVKKLTLAEY